jgi:GlpG protein
MRQIGLLDSAQEANRFTAYLIVEQIRAMVEQEGEKFAVWVREENDLARAKSEFSAFVANPTDPRYQNKEREAEAILRDERDVRTRGLKNIVEPKKQSAPLIISRRAPLCMVLLIISIAVSLLNFSEMNKKEGAYVDPNSPIWQFFFADQAGIDGALNPNASFEQKTLASFSSILRGEVWRLITPIFIHMDWAHLVFNSWGLLILGGRLETKFGAWRLGIWALTIAIFSNVAEAAFGSPYGGGLSGVLYGFFGIALIYTMRSADRSRLVTREESAIYMIWFVLCVILSSDQWGEMMGKEAMMHVGNVAHGSGLLFGAIIGLILSQMNRAPQTK